MADRSARKGTLNIAMFILIKIYMIFLWIPNLYGGEFQYDRDAAIDKKVSVCMSS